MELRLSKVHLGSDRRKVSNESNLASEIIKFLLLLIAMDANHLLVIFPLHHG